MQLISRRSSNFTFLEEKRIITQISFFFSLYLQWTYCLAASVVVGTAVWFYFITQSIKSVTYAPTILAGAGMSAMNVMSLTYLTDLIGENKVCILSLTVGAFSATCLSQTIQTTPIQSMLRPLWLIRAWLNKKVQHFSGRRSEPKQKVHQFSESDQSKWECDRFENWKVYNFLCDKRASRRRLIHLPIWWRFVVL